MNRCIRNVFIVALQFFIAASPLVVYAEEQPKYEEWIINQATLNIQIREAEKEKKLWESYDADEKYNRTYKRYVDEISECNKTVNVLKAMVDADSSKLIADDVDAIEGTAKYIYEEAGRIPPGEKSGDSLKYLWETCSALEEVGKKLSQYSLSKYYTQQHIECENWADVNTATKELNDAMKNFTEYFSKCYNYVAIAQSNGFKAIEVNQGKIEVYKYTKQSTDMLIKAYDNLDSEYKSIKKGKMQSDLMKEAKENIQKPSCFDPRISGEGIADKIREAKKCGEEACSALEKLGYSIISGGKGNDELANEKLSTFKLKVDGLKVELENMEKKNAELQNIVDKKVAAVKTAERQFLEDKGFNSMEEYKKALEEQQKSITKQQIYKEAEKINAEAKRQEEEIKAAYEAAQKKWLDERIDFAKGKANQNHDKAFYMTKVQKKLKKYSLNNTYVGTILMEEQSKAYDEMWSIAGSGNADLNSLQRLYDEYPNDFINIVFFYQIK